MAIDQINSASLATGVPTRSQLPAGCVLQVVFATTNVGVSTTSMALVASNITATITPTTATSKIYVQSSFSEYHSASGTGFAIYRNGVSIFNPSNADVGPKYYYAYTGTGAYIPVTLQYLDSPASTAAQTYTIYFANYNGTTSVVPYNGGGAQLGTGTITLMEIAA